MSVGITVASLDDFDKDDLEYFENYTGYDFSPPKYTVYDLAPPETANASLPMCNFKQLKDVYKPVHGYLSLVVCILGTLFNLLNILVLSHKDMRGNPINLILTGIAVADVLVMIEYIPFIIHDNLLDEAMRSLESKYSWGWGVFMWVHVNFTIIIHNVSIWLTLSLAIWRFIMIRHHVIAVSLCTIARCKTVLLLGYIVPIILAIPNFLAMSIHERTQLVEERNITMYIIKWSKLAESSNGLLYRLNIWFYSFFLKLVPCVVLTVFTGFLIRALYQAEENSKRIKNNAAESQTATAKDRGVQSGQSTRRKRHTDRTTRLLIVILVLFLLTEFPQGILGVLSAIFGDQFFLDCYEPLGEMMDIMALLNCSINFVLFCIMSVQFRMTFNKVLGTKQCMNKYFKSFQGRVETDALPLNSIKRRASKIVEL